ncbi:multidrug DMT transporter permease [Limnobaculum xujianqingii]|uniref:multidrug DMT transporter permease n=1 Tax=Limnobaculum xujianqingii TaxID=2738837 RepID=UPI001E577349|nr:multidrug DMT transporter permease [Limnobaculum xujianqingii]
MQEFTLSKLDEIRNKIQGLLDGLQGILDAVIAPLKTAQKYMAKIKALGSVMVNMVTVFRGDIVGFISSVKDFINYPGAFLSDLRSALDLTSLSSKSSTTNSITAYSDNTISDWKETKYQLNAIAAIPNAMITGETDAPVSMPAGATLDDIKELNAIVTAEVAAELTKNAVEILTDKEQLEKLSPDDIEMIVNDVRESLQNVIDQHRELYEPEMQSVSSSPTDIALRWQPVVLSLKDIALDVQNLGNAAIMARPPLVRRRIESDCNFHLLAHKLYGDYQRAAELYRLNPTIRDSNNIKQGDFIYAYAR